MEKKISVPLGAPASSRHRFVSELAEVIDSSSIPAASEHGTVSVNERSN